MTVPDSVALGSVHAYARECTADDGGRSLRSILDLVGDKWSLLIIGALVDGPRRFGDIRLVIPEISQRMQTRTLRKLERDGLVRRESFAEVPPRVEYSLTDDGRTLIQPAGALALWAVEHVPKIVAARAAFDARHGAVGSDHEVAATDPGRTGR